MSEIAYGLLVTPGFPGAPAGTLHLKDATSLEDARAIIERGVNEGIWLLVDGGKGMWLSPLAVQEHVLGAVATDYVSPERAGMVIAKGNL